MGNKSENENIKIGDDFEYGYNNVFRVKSHAFCLELKQQLY